MQKKIYGKEISINRTKVIIVRGLNECVYLPWREINEGNKYMENKGKGKDS